ncbi:hypothetical protein [Oceanospirillum sanctuarii]|nr:hypothetical protein [Oceanospirillum sanctuarii]
MKSGKKETGIGHRSKSSLAGDALLKTRERKDKIQGKKMGTSHVP